MTWCTGIAAAVMVAALGGCASSERPVLYPNAHLQSVGDAVAQRDIDQCLQLADNSGLPRANNQVLRHGAEGTAVGAAAGSAGSLVSGGNVGAGAVTGAAIGAAAGAVHGAFRNDANPTYRNFAQHCLQDRGYDVIGWQ
ncbi:MAG: cell envelope biogenesis protein OmpA [Alphaproteobacteria bacterium]|nr:cell envelope biogenesis protein OmpA [Alphaproteobacteria bacterium]